MLLWKKLSESIMGRRMMKIAVFLGAYPVFWGRELLLVSYAK